MNSLKRGSEASKMYCLYTTKSIARVYSVKKRYIQLFPFFAFSLCLQKKLVFFGFRLIVSRLFIPPYKSLHIQFVVQREWKYRTQDALQVFHIYFFISVVYHNMYKIFYIHSYLINENALCLNSARPSSSSITIVRLHQAYLKLKQC